MKRFIFLLCLIVLLYACTKSNNSQSKKLETPYYDKAFELLDAKKTDSAFRYFDKAKNSFLQYNDSLRASACLINMAMISTDFGDHFGGQEIALEALHFLDTNNKSHFPYLHSIYNTLGITAFSLKNYKQAIVFYNNSLKYSNDSTYSKVTKNNIGNAYRNLKNYPKAINIYQEILAQPAVNQREYARTLSNISYTKWLNNADYHAQNDFLKALYIRKKEHDIWGQNASYSHLADYYEHTRPDSALYYAQQMYHTAITLNSPDDQLEALQKLIKLSRAYESKEYFGIYQQLTDSLQTSRNTAKNQFALIRFETEKHKADNLALQKENTEKKYQIIITITVSMLALIIGIFWYRRRQQHTKLVAENTIRENQLKTSKKVHDVVANGLYRVMTEIENQDEIDKNHILDKIEDMYEKSRDISYDQITTSLINFQDKISDLLNSFASANIKVKIRGNTKALWQKTSEKIQYEIEHVLQELMVNMKRHSQATYVTISFEQSVHEIKIRYSDNGVGIPQGVQFKNGLTNTGNRINNISGSITFDSKSERGLEIHISFPIS